MSIQAALLPDGKRLHLNHGPIDLVIEASGRANNIAKAYEAATRRFAHVLHGLVSELALLRREVKEKADWPNGEIARRMVEVTAPHWADRVTPMAAVAGSVADNILATMMQTAELDRAYVNNGGDIAIHLAAGQHYAIASTAGMLSLSSSDGIQGIATSGWSGRSFSLGIADSVTVLAASAAEADVAATLIANAVDLPQSAKVTREPANVLSPDSDLGSRLVTTAVAALTPEEKRAALTAGHAVANGFLRRGFIVAAAFRLQGLVSYAGECQHFSASSLKLPAKAQELVHA
jgi:uncharacterized protein